MTTISPGKNSLLLYSVRVYLLNLGEYNGKNKNDGSERDNN